MDYRPSNILGQRREGHLIRQRRDGRCIETTEGEGASKGRNNLAAFLRERGVDIPEGAGFGPPTNEDFWYAIQRFAVQRGADVKMKPDKIKEQKILVGKLLKYYKRLKAEGIELRP